jgi:hypothetical protein
LEVSACVKCLNSKNEISSICMVTG